MVVVGLVAVALLVLTARSGFERSSGRGAGRVTTLGWALAAAAVLLVPAAATGSVVAEALGPFDSPFQPPIATRVLHQVFAPQPNPGGLEQLQAVQRGAPFLMAAQTSAVASVFIYATGEEVLPLGGYTGATPSPSVATVRSLLAHRDFHLALIASPAATPAASYIAAHCLHVPQPGGRPASLVAPKLRIYYCAGPARRSSSWARRPPELRPSGRPSSLSPMEASQLGTKCPLPSAFRSYSGKEHAPTAPDQSLCPGTRLEQWRPAEESRRTIEGAI